MAELKVGDKRSFSFTDKKYSIREIIDTPEIKMKWSWDTCVCPVCKNKITNEIEHTFYRIEILGESGVLDNQLTKDSVMCLGYTVDGRNLLLTIDKQREALAMSIGFKGVK